MGFEARWSESAAVQRGHELADGYEGSAVRVPLGCHQALGSWPE